jgi:DNA-binding transcriptional LysR family regulator
MDRLDWNMARAFTATADAGSLSAAARVLGLTQPTLSRQVAALEAGLGVVLFERIGKRLVLTDTGRRLLEPARRMAAAADALALAAAGTQGDGAGRVSLSATEAISAHLLPEVVARICRALPQISLAIVASDQLSDLQRREADIAIRHVRPKEPELICRSMGVMQAHFYASEAWLAANGPLHTTGDLANVDLVGFEPIEGFIAHLAKAGISVPRERFRIVTANSVVLWEMVRCGLGVGIMLREIAERQAGMVRLLPDVPGTPVPVWLVSHRELHTNRRVRMVFDMLAEEISGRWCRPAGK